MSAPYITPREAELERRAYRGDRDALDELELMYAESPEEKALADIDGFGDWLGAELYQAQPVAVGYVPAASAPQHIRDNFALLIETKPTPWLMALALQGHEWAASAMRTLRDRYLVSLGIAS
jgi:hypothetical protein